MDSRRWGSGPKLVLRVAAALAIAAAVVPGAASARFLYVIQEGNPVGEKQGIRTMSIAADGTLSNGPAFTSVGSAGYVSAAMSPDGRHLFPAAWQASRLSGFSVNPDGSVIGDGNSAQFAIYTPYGISVAPNGRFVFVANDEPANVSAFDASSGIPSSIAAYPAGSHPRGVATTPDGAHVYVANRSTDNISAYNVGPTGALTHIADFPLPAGPPVATGPEGIVISPDGGHLFSANNASGNITSFAIDPKTGLLTPVGTFPSTNGSLNTLALSPDGRHLFATQIFGPNVIAFNVGADGSVSQVGAAVSTGGELNSDQGIAVTPDGKYVFATSEGLSYKSSVAAFAIQPSGALVGVIGSPFSTAMLNVNFQSLVIAPDQSPVPSFTAAPAKKGTKVSFDGSASTDPDGAIARYDWDFGDGKALADGGPQPSHSYATPGRYTVTLDVTDNEGCSTRLVYTGQTASCSGSSPAAQSITAGRLALTLGGAKKQALSKKGIKLRVKCNVGACKVKASARVKGLGLKSKAASLSAPKAGKKRTLRMKFSKKTFQALREALAAGGKLTVKVKATAKARGLSASAKRGVTLTG